MQKRTTISPWLARLAYAAALLAVVWFFEHKMAAQARWHSAVTEVAPLAVEVLEEGNRELYKKIVSENYLYPFETEHKRKAWIVLHEVKKFSNAVISEQKRPREGQSGFPLQESIADMASLSDVIWYTCDTFPEIFEAIRAALPVFSDTLQRQLSDAFSQRYTDDASHWAALLRLRASLAGATAIHYCYAKVSVSPCWVLRHPLLNPVQTCPKVGELFKAAIYVPCVEDVTSIYEYTATVNGELGRNYKHRFDMPGRHVLSVLIEARDPWDTTFVTSYTRDFEVLVRPR